MPAPSANRRLRLAVAVLSGVLGALLVAALVAPRGALLGLVGIDAERAAALVMAEPALQDRALAAVLADPALRSALEARLAAERVDAIYDAHPDPDVARVLAPSLIGAAADGVRIDSNSLGLRERPVSWRKPRGTTRIVLLGDSYIFGVGAEARDRVGVHLERLLAPHCPTERLEVLHVGISSWNVQSEVAFVRRQIDVLRPSLIVHVVCANDLADTTGARGIGVQASFSPQARVRGETRIGSQTLAGLFRGPVPNLLLYGVDWEGRTRMERARRDVAALASAAARVDCEYLLLAMVGEAAPWVRASLAADLPPAQVAFISEDFRRDATQFVAPNDGHWNALGHERLAQGLYALLAQRGVLARWELEPDAEARAQRERIFDRGEALARDEEGYRAWVAAARIGPAFEFPPANRRLAAQATGGVDPDGRLAPYASFCLANRGDAVVLDAEPLGRTSLAGASATVFVEEFPVGSVPLDDPGAFPARFALPEAVRGREFVSVRLVASDWAFVDHTGSPACLTLRSVAIE